MRYQTKTEAQKAWRRDRARLIQEIRFVQWEVEDALLTELAEVYEGAEVMGDKPVEALVDRDSIRELVARTTQRLLEDV